MQVISIIGPTGAGKSTLLRKLKEKSPVKTATIEIGKLLRAKYPPSYFEGSMAPAKTEQEVAELFDTMFKQAVQDGVELLVVDGQPRTPAQVDQIIKLCGDMCAGLTIFHLYSPHGVRAQRLNGRDASPEAKALNEGRLKSDTGGLYEILMHLEFNHPDQVAYGLRTVDTREPGSLDELCEDVFSVPLKDWGSGC